MSKCSVADVKLTVNDKNNLLNCCICQFVPCATEVKLFKIITYETLDLYSTVWTFWKLF